jgi:predicted branched-subunit amino acid permease
MFNRRKALLAVATKGALNMLPLSLAVLPWGILFGSLAIQRGFSWIEAQLSVRLFLVVRCRSSLSN